MRTNYAVVTLVPTLCVGTSPADAPEMRCLSGGGRGASGLHSHAERGNEIRCVTHNILYKVFLSSICVHSWQKTIRVNSW